MPSPVRRDALHPSYDLRASQIETPRKIVKFFWEIVHRHRPRLGSVLDMGAGDGKFAHYGNYGRYLGLEIDPARITNRRPRKHARVTAGCVFARSGKAFDGCIGNPPYLRHQDIESPWKEATLSKLRDELGVEISGHSNLFLYFLALGLLRTTANGLTALLVPFDWVSRPSARNLREAIDSKGWNTSVYRFSFPIFAGVDTTASISIVDKSMTEGRWTFYDVSDDLRIEPRRGLTGTGHTLLKYRRRRTREKLFARRGMSPGIQSVFTLTDGERIHHGLTREDVRPCVTTLREVDDDLHVLDRRAFETHFVAAGRRCWLLKSRAAALSDRLRRYLDGVAPEERNTATCRRQDPWYNYEAVPAPDILVHSGFTNSGPRLLLNTVRAIPVGSMYGIYGCPKGRAAQIQAFVASRRVFSRVVPHSRRLRKLEVGQLNSILSRVAVRDT